MIFKKWGLIIGISIFLLACFPLLGYLESFAYNTIRFSKSDHFFDHDIKVRLTELPGHTIYYTLNGDTPTQDASLYSEPILIPLPQEGISVVTIRAIAYAPDQSVSSENTHTYFVGQDIFERYHSLITILTTDSHHLYDYDTGILVEGRLRDEWIKANPDRTIKPTRPANYNLRGIESERPTYLEVFSPAGELLLSQKAGIRVNGGYSRANVYKSFKLHADKNYGHNKFCYEFFPDSRTYLDKRPTMEYKHVILRNIPAIENAILLHLVKDLKNLDSQECLPCVGYLNGSYYHSGWLLEDFDNAYFHSNYGTKEEQGSWEVVADYNVEVMKGVAPDTNYETLSAASAASDKAYIDSFASRDFRDDRVLEEFSELVDLQNLLLYFAVEIYAGNSDWPYNNIEMYRWYSNTSDYTAGSHTDGKWRYLLYDLDGGFSSDYDFNLISHVFEIENTQARFHALFYSLMQREDLQTEFKSIITELMDTVFEPEHACQVIQEYFSISEQELLSAIASDPTADTAYLHNQWQRLIYRRDLMLEFAKKRPTVILQQIDEAFSSF